MLLSRNLMEQTGRNDSQNGQHRYFILTPPDPVIVVFSSETGSEL